MEFVPTKFAFLRKILYLCRVKFNIICLIKNKKKDANSGFTIQRCAYKLGTLF